MNKIRTRFAPSPTGALHLGAVRTALFAWLFARHNGGDFVLRIEDTDQNREVAGASEVIMETLNWLGLSWDEGPNVGGDLGPYFQSKRLELYKKYSDILIEQGKAYRCWCSPERLNNLRQEAQANKVAFKYDRHCLNNPGDPTQPHVVRILIPDGEPISWHDLIKGNISFERKDIDDFVGLKSDGFPTYHLANVIDDHLMQITHVIRSDEWLSSTPKHIILYEAFGWPKPFFAHTPNVLGSDGRLKLSKRRGAKSVLQYREEGYLQSALINLMATLGWNDGTEQEVYSVDELIDKFTLERVQKSPAVLDEKRLLWLDGAHIRSLNQDELYKHAKNFLPKTAANYPQQYQKDVLAITQERLKYFSEIPELTNYFFDEPNIDLSLIDNNKQLKKFSYSELADLLKKSLDELTSTEWQTDKIQATLNNLLETTGQKPGVLFSLIRVAVSWSPSSPGLADTLNVLGNETSISRIQKTIEALNN